MAMNAPAWILSQAFTKETADEFGAVKGAPCTVGDVSYDADGNTVVELVWTNSAGASRTTPVTIKKGLGIKAVTVDADEHLILTMTDDTTIDAGEIPKPDLTDYAKKSEIPTKVEDLDDAEDYAKKSEIPEGSVVDEDLSETSKNPVQNKIVTAELKKKVDAVAGKELSSNDYDNASKAKVDAIPGDPKYTDTVYDDTDVKKDIAKKIDIQQKTEDKGKALVVGEDGKVIPTEISTDTSMIEKAIADNWNGNGYNLVPLPYYSSDGNKRGVNFTTNKDGSISINGSNNGTTQDFSLISNSASYIDNMFHGKVGATYNIVYEVDGELPEGCGIVSNGFDSSGNVTPYFNSNTEKYNKPFTVVEEAPYFSLYIQNRAGFVFDNVTVRIMLVEVAEDGSYPTQYQRNASGNVELTQKLGITQKSVSDNWGGNGYNLISFPYYDSNVSNRNGIDWSVDDNGIVYATGTSTASRFNLHTRSKGELNDWTLENGDYYFYVESNCTDDRITVQFQITKNDTYFTLANVLNGGAKVEISGDDHYTDKVSPQVQIYIPNGVIVDNVYFKIMLLKYNPNGSYPTEYQRYASGNVKLTDSLTDVNEKISQKADRTEIIGENILPFPYTDGSSATTNGITFTVDNDGVVTINGTPTGDAYFWLTPHATLNDYTLIEDGKEYVLSGNENVYPNEWGVCLFARIIDEDGTTAHYEFSYSGKSAIFSKEKYPNAKYYAILMRVSNKQVTSQLTNVIVKPMLEYGNTAHDFQPYRLNRNVIEKDAVMAKVNNFVKPTSNAEILALSNGIYSINVDDTTLFPNRWGTLIVLKSGYVYGSMIFIGADARYWFRNTNSGAWRETAWQELATMDKVAEEDGTVPFNISLGVDRNELFKVGKVVTFNALFGSISGLSTKNTTFATIPEGFRPKTEKRLVGCIGETFQEFSIGTDGTIKCITSSIPGGATICAFNGSWLTD